MRFDDRRAAGRRLAWHLDFLRGRHAIVLGLTRGGVPLAFEVAQELGAPLDVLAVRKLGVPWQPELAFGAIGEDGVRVLNDDVILRTGLTQTVRASVEDAERAALDEQVLHHRAIRAPVPVTGHTAVIVDDGCATGATAQAACLAARRRGAGEVVLAVPVAPMSVVERLRRITDDLFCLQSVQHLGSIGAWYDDFSQVSDDDVRRLLEQATRLAPAPRLTVQPDPARPSRELPVSVAGVRLAAQLAVPDTAQAVVVFALAGSSGRNSPRNRYTAATLNRAGLGTLLLDLLTEEEDQERGAVFDIRLLAHRLHAATLWLRHHVTLPVAYFGAETGAAAALEAAAVSDSDILAVVARSGRTDLASRTALAQVRAPVLLIVGGQDPGMLSVNRLAADWLTGDCGLAVIPAATHLFTEPGALAAAAELARDWFTGHLATAPALAEVRPLLSARSA
ncbi:phosphoribosyltransferase family protein [Streptomyces sp. Q6]|uniref:Phosphoribosyltransferase family protein n=1 Tax=Streptomyces citrinus TaxID=3118173 RepID=A0ACD5AMM9_9ACTN